MAPDLEFVEILAEYPLGMETGNIPQVFPPAEAGLAEIGPAEIGLAGIVPAEIDPAEMEPAGIVFVEIPPAEADPAVIEPVEMVPVENEIVIADYYQPNLNIEPPQVNLPRLEDVPLPPGIVMN